MELLLVVTRPILLSKLGYERYATNLREKKRFQRKSALWLGSQRKWVIN